MTTLTGHWLGVYWQMGSPTHFEMELTELGGVVSGIIRDQGHLGTATMSGDRVAAEVRFEKKYLHAPDWVRYRGTLSSDGLTLAGQWTIPKPDAVHPADQGPWQAERTSRSIGLEETHTEHSTETVEPGAIEPGA